MKTVIALLIALLSQLALALNIQYCSSLNTASTNRNTSAFQSSSLCRATCLSNYAFAILQGDGCWCSSYIPMNTIDTSECDEPCPGLSTDTCGGQGLFAYIPLIRAPIGTDELSVMSSAMSSTTSSATSSNSSSNTAFAPNATLSEGNVVTTAFTTSDSALPTYTAASTPSWSSSSSGISTSAKFSIGIGCAFVVIATTVGIMFLFRRQKGTKSKARRAPVGQKNNSYPANQNYGSGVLARTLAERTEISSIPGPYSPLDSLEQSCQAQGPEHHTESTTLQSQQDRRASHFALSIHELAANRPLSSQDTASSTVSSVYELESYEQPPRYSYDTSIYPVEQHSKETVIPPSLHHHPAYQTRSPASPASPVSPLSSPRIRDIISSSGYHHRAQSQHRSYARLTADLTRDPRSQEDLWN